MSTGTSPYVYNPAPGTEYPFSISDIARAARTLLGPRWLAESGHWGTTGTLSAAYTADFTLSIDSEGDLCIDFTRYTEDGFPETPELPEGVEDMDGGVYLPVACSVDGLDELAGIVAAAIRAVTGCPPYTLAEITAPAELDLLPTVDVIAVRDAAENVLQRRGEEALPGMVHAAVRKFLADQPDARPLGVRFTTKCYDDGFFWDLGDALVSFPDGTFREVDLTGRDDDLKALNGALIDHAKWAGEVGPGSTLTVQFDPPALVAAL
ncbi:hypothetical protein EV284_6404 [Streptomyces sp. BK022]|uniref:hypothetical protein n=1 Tax=Streptomyces sp. BK022 TaxID=2512123 RepID=UPI001029247C|nr:hypothetical protein [Streptomyces sp. BK022]RZU28238.1 hypothetical protein EV284_6404 [Streptomyces sp. BK022]